MHTPAIVFKAFVCILAIVVMHRLIGCSKSPEQVPPQTIRISVLPDEDIEALCARYTPLVEFLIEETGLTFEFVPADDYAHILQLFHDKKIDLVRFGGLTFLKAYHQDNAVPLVMRDVDHKFTSYFFVRADSDVTSLDDSQGMTIAFGSKLSTSGHLMPRYYLNDMGIDPETYFADVAYSGAHDKTIEMVQNGTVQVGAVNSFIVDAMYKSGEINQNEIRILWETPPYVAYVWAVQDSLPQDIQNIIRDGFLTLTEADPLQEPILKAVQAAHYLPSNIQEFVDLQNVAADEGLLEAKQ